MAIQRYQAGEEGHGGIEQRALTAVGFSEVEAGQIYFGNWLRDFSQLNGSGSPLSPPDLMSLFTVIRILGWGEYNREVAPEELGTYVPSEHLDNPDAAGLHPDVAAPKRTVEDPALQALAERYPEGDARRAPFDEAFARLSPDQKAAYRSEEARRGEITEAARRSGLPTYIERGKMHAKDKLRAAIRDGRTPAGMQKMGDALHALEDYFSHSNFVDVALWTLHNEGVAAAKPYVEAMVQRMHGTNPALVGGVGPGGQPAIVTGTYSPGANDRVSQLELLKAQLHSGEFAKAFLIGLIRLGTVSAAEVARALGRGVGATVGGSTGAVVGGVAGAVSGAVEGAGSGASSGFEAGAQAGYRSGYAFGGGGVVGEALGQAEGALEGAVGGVTGLVSGAYHGLVGGGASGARAGADYGAAVVGDAGAAVGGAVVDAAGTVLLGEAELAMLVGSPLLKAQLAAPLLVIDAVIEHLADQQTTQSGVQAASRGLAGPTHSQIAKDAPDHPLFGVSVKLAEEADRQVGRAIQTAWAARMAAGAAPGQGDPVTDAEADPVTSLIDTYVSQPASNPWWRPVLVSALA